MDVLFCVVNQLLPLGDPELRHQECGWLFTRIRNHEPVRLFLLLVVGHPILTFISYSVGGSVDPYLGTGSVSHL
jgi:hypothetical protein